jgi:NAD(P)-dependent dehydrogenase (short-subunit alcohol dehydrogenase family)
MAVAIITGGGSLMSKGIAETLVDRGWKVELFDLKIEDAEDVATHVGGAKVAGAHHLDVTDYRGTVRLTKKVAKKHGGIDALVTVAGGSVGLGLRKSAFVDTDQAYWRKMIDTNYKGTLNSCHAVLPYMLKQKSGGIVCMASGAGLPGGPPEMKQYHATLYTCAKACIIVFVKALAQEVGPHGVRVNSVNPGRNPSRWKTEDDLRGRLAAERAHTGIARTSPLGEFSSGKDVGNGVAFLLSEDAHHITGTLLDISGGVALH